MNRFLLFLLMLTIAVACNKDEVITTEPLPVIVLDNQNGVYTLKHGHSLTITPSVTGAQSYAWLLDGSVVSTSLTYTFQGSEVGTYYLTFRATNDSGKAEEQLRIEVMELQPPIIGFALEEQGVMTLAAGVEYTLAPEVLNGQSATYEWLLDGKSVGSSATLTHTFASTGEHSLTLTVSNDDGTASQNISLQIVNRLAGKAYIATQRNIPLGRTLHLSPTLRHFSNASYKWSVAGQGASTDEIFAFTPTHEGDHTVTLTLTDSDGYTLTTDIVVTCTPSEGEYRRTASSTSKATWDKVYEYMPAPGQFINEDKSGFEGVTTTEQARLYAEKRLSESKYLSLGGWGGYVVVGFDHSIENSGGNDFSIAGNMFDDSSEAGIVWVMQDTNGNGLPDDEWYELKGSEWGTENHTQHYAVTYYRTAGAGMSVQWHDNQGEQGRITRNTTHTHDFYYPTWIDAMSYTLCGSRLAHNTTIDSSGKYTNNPYAWGYADNNGSDADTTPSAGNAVKCYFKISNAVNVDGSAADLQYIDFIKVQSAVNHVAGPLGEISTEVLGIEDENL